MLVQIQLFEVFAFALGDWNIWNFKLLENAGENSGRESVSGVGRIVVSPTPSDDNIFFCRILQIKKTHYSI
jgi:hypothetical protein